MVLGTVSVILFALGMCMANHFGVGRILSRGVIFGCVGSASRSYHTDCMEENGTQAAAPYQRKGLF